MVGWNKPGKTEALFLLLPFFFFNSDEETILLIFLLWILYLTPIASEINKTLLCLVYK